MQCLKDNKLEFNENTLYNVRKEFNLHRPGEIDKAIDILEEWVKQQKHFTRKQFRSIGLNFDNNYFDTTLVRQTTTSTGFYFDRTLLRQTLLRQNCYFDILTDRYTSSAREDLERMLIINKGSIERTKRKLDKTLTFRTLMPEYFDEYDVKNDFKEFDGILFQALLPKMTADDCRVYTFRNIGKKFESTLIRTFYRTLALFAEYIRKHDYSRNYIVIIDYREVNLMELASKMNPIDFQKGMALLIEGYGFRMKALHILSDSKFIDLVVKIFKQVMSQKLGERIQVHKTLENLYKFVPKDLLPEEYGGKEKSLVQLHDEWFKLFGSKEYKDFFKETSETRVDEAFRPTDQFNDQCMGMPGTFRSLTVD